MNALRRQLSATGWQAVGFFGASLVFATAAIIWGIGIESRIDTVVVQRQHDHQTIHRLVVHEAEALGGSVAGSGPPSPPSPTRSPGGLSPAHPKGGSGNGKGGGEGGTGPKGGGEAPAPGSTGANPGQGSGGSEESTSPEKQGVLPSTVEAAGGAAGEVVGEVGGAVKGVGEGLGAAGCQTLGSC